MYYLGFSLRSLYLCSGDMDMVSITIYLSWASFRNCKTHVIVHGVMCGDSQVTGLCSCQQQGEGERKLYERNMDLLLTLNIVI